MAILRIVDNLHSRATRNITGTPRSEDCGAGRSGLNPVRRILSNLYMRSGKQRRRVYARPIAVTRNAANTTDLDAREILTLNHKAIPHEVATANRRGLISIPGNSILSILVQARESYMDGMK